MTGSGFESAAAPGTDSARRRGWPSGWAIAARGAVLLVAVGALVRTFARADWRGASTLLAEAGPRVILVLLPFPIAMALDVLAHRRLLRELDQPVPYRPLYAVRLVVEAITMSLPGGTVFAETVNPLLLKRRCGIAYDTSVIASAAKRWLIIRAQAVYIVLSVVLGSAALTRASTALLGRDGLALVVLAAAMVPLVTSLLLGAALFGGALSQKAGRALRALPNQRLRAFVDARQSGLVATDGRLARLSSARRALWIAAVLLFFGWLLESVDAFVILRVLGVNIGFSDVIAFEAGLGLVRSVVFFVPAGLGVQDLGYIAFFSALGLPRASTLGAAFLVLKRTKEALFILVGYALFFLLRRMPSAPALATGGLTE